MNKIDALADLLDVPVEFNGLILIRLDETPDGEGPVIGVNVESETLQVAHSTGAGTTVIDYLDTESVEEAAAWIKARLPR